jgi:hypothetical protein
MSWRRGLRFTFVLFLASIGGMFLNVGLTQGFTAETDDPVDMNLRCKIESATVTYSWGKARIYDPDYGPDDLSRQLRYAPNDGETLTITVGWNAELVTDTKPCYLWASSNFGGSGGISPTKTITNFDVGYPITYTVNDDTNTHEIVRVSSSYVSENTMQAGNTITLTFSYDNAPPTSTLSFPQAEVGSGEPILLVWEARDPDDGSGVHGSGVQKIEIWRTGTDVSPKEEPDKVVYPEGELSGTVEVPSIGTTLDGVITAAYASRATDNVGNPQDPQSADQLVRVVPQKIYLPIVLRNYSPPVNFGFEMVDQNQKPQGWVVDEVGLPVSVVSSVAERGGNATAPSEGTKLLLLGNPNLSCDGMPYPAYAGVEQTITIPEGATKMSFDYVIWSQDASVGASYDRFEVYLDGELVFNDGNKVSKGLSCNQWWRVPGSDNLRDGKQSGWATGEVALPIEGGNVTIWFRNYSRYDKWYNTYTYIDNLRFEFE